ncbi:hypothetical protein ACQ4PT_024436 [Festuca glaucescens]
MAGIACAASVTQLVGLAFKIMKAAANAHHNKDKCDDLALRVYAIADHLLRLKDPEAMGPVVGLRDALEQAHKLITQSRTRRFVKAIFQPDSFDDVNKRIDSFLLVFLIGINRGRNGTGNVPVPNSSAVHPHSSMPAVSRAESEPEGAEKFTLARIKEATSNFADVLGEGDSGKVYKGELDGRAVAVKRLKNGPRRRADDVFGTELVILRQLSHKHIVRLVGSCADEEERVLVYENMDNGTLRDHLQNNASELAASWKRRVQVLLGAACAIEHLHCHARPQLIHSNVTSSNILLDRRWQPRVSGFGASVWRAPGAPSQAVEVVHTNGYQDPEYRRTGLLKPATDVYSFGVVMLEVLTGREPVVGNIWEETKRMMIDKMLVPWALTSIKDRKLGEVLDRRPASEPTTSQKHALQLVADTASSCLRQDGDNRPAISEVVASLEKALHLIC